MEKEELYSYVEQGLSDAKIAQLLNLDKQTIYRWRKEYGISSRYKIKLDSLPPLTDYQKELLIGSMLGDGTICKNSNTKGVYSEGHGIKQLAYLEWKKEILEDYVSRFVVYDTFCSLATISHPYFLDMFYQWYPCKTEGRYTKRIPKNITLTPLSLAVWYMDDGSSSGHQVRISFGLDHDSLLHALDALNRLGFNPELHWDKRIRTPNVCGIYFKETDSDKFKEMVKKYIHPSLQYKLSQEITPRMMLLKNARKLTHKVATDLLKEGHTIEQIAYKYDVSNAIVKRRLIKDVQEAGRPKLKLSPLDADVKLETLTDIDEIIKLLLETQFPYIRKNSFYYIKDRLKSFDDVKVSIVGDIIDSSSYMGNDICLSYMDHMFSVTKGNREYSTSVYDAWSIEKQLYEAVSLLQKRGSKLNCNNVRNLLSFTHRAPTNFRPVVAKYIIDNYCPMFGTIYDPCAGWGGRLFGFCKSIASRYIGIDVELKTVDGLRNLYADIEPHLDQSKEVFLYCKKTQEYIPKDKVDLVFTSPPYFKAEIYSESLNQSCNEFPTYDAWICGFLLPMIKNSYQCLNDDGYIALCVGDYTCRKKVYPIVQDTKDIIDQNFGSSFVLKYLLRSTDKYESIILAKKVSDTLI